MTVTKKQRSFVRKRANYHCEYCKRPEKWVTLNLEVEHIKPQAKGGSDEDNNLAGACRECNQHKSDRETCANPETDQEVALFNPRTQKWSEHFKWSGDGSYMIGLSSTGKATIDCLQMNDPRLCKARMGWRKFGWIPPQD